MKKKDSDKKVLSARTRAKIRQRTQFLAKIDNRFKWLGAGMFCFALFAILSFFPEFTETYYSRGIFIIFRYFYDYTLGLLPFSSTIWLNLIFFIWFFYKTFKYVQFNITNREVSIYNRLKYSALAAGSFLGKVSVLFFVGWGFNYQRIPIEDTLDIELRSLNEQEVIQEANIIRKLSIDAREKISGLTDTTTFNASYLPTDIENIMRASLDDIFKKMGYPTPGRIRCRTIDDDYWLQKFGYTGIYISFYGEALISGHVPPIYKPFFIAHEMVHGYGFFDEADANFFAYLACEASGYPAIVYAGRLAHLTYIKHELKGLRLKLPNPILNDFKRNGSFGSQEEYNRMILLVHAWRKKYPLQLQYPIEHYQKTLKR